MWRQAARVPFIILEQVLAWQTRAAERRHLMALPDHLLKDIGMSRADAVREAAKPFWRY